MEGSVEVSKTESVRRVTDHHAVRVGGLDPREVTQHFLVDEEVRSELPLPQDLYHGQGGGQDVLLQDGET